MKRESKLMHSFVEYIPDTLDDGVVYISLSFSTAIHKCCCGCGSQVVTPLSPTDWSFTFDGESVSFYPSIGNWGFACRSHYWIKKGRVKWAGHMTSSEINTGRVADHLARKRYYHTKSPEIELLPSNPVSEPPAPAEHTIRNSWWNKLKSWFES